MMASEIIGERRCKSECSRLLKRESNTMAIRAYCEDSAACIWVVNSRGSEKIAA